MDDKRLIERPLSAEKIYDGAILRVERLTVALPNDKTAYREIVRAGGAAAVVPVDEHGDVYLVRQYRAPFDRILLEIPAGKKSSRDEDPLCTARRELREETGLTAEKFVHLSDIFPTPGFCDEVLSLYLALGLSTGETQPDEDEFLSVVKLPFARACAMAVAGEIRDAKSVCALLLARDAIKVQK
jgi:ADP-ribose pyrophosphatase